MTAMLGLSAFYHDNAVALVVDGRIVAAAQEERFTQVKHDHRFPTNAIEYCLTQAGLSPGKFDHVAFYDKPFLKFERLLETYLADAPLGLRSFMLALPLWLRQKPIEIRLRDFLTIDVTHRWSLTSAFLKVAINRIVGMGVQRSTFFKNRNSCRCCPVSTITRTISVTIS